jgi:hypothetical protein
LARDREMLISSRARGFKALAPMRLADCVPLKIVVPGTHNIRRRNLETYFQTNGIPIEDTIEMDAMIGTLEFVARSDWVAVLPSIICINDVGRGDLVVNPIVDPPLFAEFVVISPARRPLGGEARRFLERMENEIAKIRASWKEKFRARTRKTSRVDGPPQCLEPPRQPFDLSWVPPALEPEGAAEVPDDFAWLAPFEPPVFAKT